MTRNQVRILLESRHRPGANYYVGNLSGILEAAKNISLVLTLFYVVYTKHPYYLRDQFSPWRPIFRTIFIGWLALGLPYVVAALKEFTKRSLWFTDTGLHFLLMGRYVYKRVKGQHASHIWRSKRLRTSRRGSRQRAGSRSSVGSRATGCGTPSSCSASSPMRRSLVTTRTMVR